MKFSLIMATLGRTWEVERFLTSLTKQTYQDFELIVVDQNSDNRLASLLEAYADNFSIFCLRARKGISRARNAGLECISGDIVAFPDVDCQYPPNLLERVAQLLTSHPELHGIAGRSVDEGGKPSAARFSTESGAIDKFNVWTRSISISIFLRRSAVQGLWFNEELGVGSGTAWGSSEETEFLLQLLDRKAKLYYDPSLVVIHPSPTERYDNKALRRAYSYGSGAGRVLRTHQYPLWFVLYHWARPFGGTLLALARGRTTKAKYHWAVLRGRIFGWSAKQELQTTV